MARDKHELMNRTGERLRALMSDLDIDTVEGFAELIGASRSQASNWLNGYHLAPVRNMVTLCEETKVTLDWIYRGDGSGLTYATQIRLSAISENMKPVDVPPEPDIHSRPKKQAGTRPKKTGKAPVQLSGRVGRGDKVPRAG
jgi:transcriptional regulator with XRE-family HTH domain